eukprot:scpid63922/ scgid28762/ 
MCGRGRGDDDGTPSLSAQTDPACNTTAVKHTTAVEITGMAVNQDHSVLACLHKLCSIDDDSWVNRPGGFKSGVAVQDRCTGSPHFAIHNTQHHVRAGRR